jgi:hypothetical protein
MVSVRWVETILTFKMNAKHLKCFSLDNRWSVDRKFRKLCTESCFMSTIFQELVLLLIL